MKVFLSDKARSDLLQFYGYLAERSPSAARAALETINVKFANLTRFPFIGRERSTLGAGVRSLVAGTQVIFYTVEKSGSSSSGCSTAEGTSTKSSSGE
jgi:plasmid stabilization system protein ParE